MAILKAVDHPRSLLAHARGLTLSLSLGSIEHVNMSFNMHHTWLSFTQYWYYPRMFSDMMTLYMIDQQKRSFFVYLSLLEDAWRTTKKKSFWGSKMKVASLVTIWGAWKERRKGRRRSAVIRFLLVPALQVTFIFTTLDSNTIGDPVWQSWVTVHVIYHSTSVTVPPIMRIARLSSSCPLKHSKCPLSHSILRLKSTDHNTVTQERRTCTRHTGSSGLTVKVSTFLSR